MGWQRVRGHEAQIEGFRRVIQRGRLAHAYLYAGPPGIGKRLFAVEFARAWLCEKPKGQLAACDACPACVQIDAGTHPDFVHAARPADENEFPIDLMRKVCASFSLKSARGKGKVVIIDDADDLNEESANCFLKTLEEPPQGAVLILIGSSPQRQLLTITSRCQVVRFAPLSADLVQDILMTAGVEDAALRERLVRMSGGSPGHALMLSDPAVLEFREQLLEALTSHPFDPAAMGKLMTAFVKTEGEESAVHRKRAHLMVRLLVDFFEDVLAVAMGGEPRRAVAAENAMIETLAGRCGAEALLTILDRCLQTEAQIDRRVTMALLLEALCDALSQNLGR